MAEQIRDGKGRGYLMGVDDENRALTRAITSSAERHANISLEEAYQVLFSRTPTAAGDCFFYMKNLSDDNLVVEGISFRVASAEQVQVKLNDSGSPSGGTAVTPVNCKALAGNEADGTFEHGVDITSLSGGDIVDHIWLTSTKSEHYNFEQDIVLPKNGVLSLYVVTGAVAIAGTVVFNFTKEE